MSSTTIKVVIDGKGSISGLDNVNKGLKLVQDNANKTQQAVAKAVKVNGSDTGIATLGKSFSSLGANIGQVKNILAGGIIGAAVIRGISAAVDESVKLQNALIGVDSVARSFSQNTDDVKKAILEFTKDGLVSATEAALAFKQVLSTGTQLPETIKLLNSLKDTAAFNRQSFYSLGEAIIATTEGIKNGNSIRADAVGVTKNLSVLEKEYAASLGRTVGSLTDQEKIQARVAGFIREGAFAQGDAAKLLDTYSGSVQRLGSAYDRVLAKIGDFITQSGLVKTTIQGLTRVMNDLAEGPDTTEKKIEKIKSQLNGFLKDISNLNSPYKRKLEEELRELERITAEKGKQSAIDSELLKKEIDKKNALVASAKAAVDAVVERNKAIKALDKKIQFGGDSDLEKLEKFYSKGVKLAAGNVERRLKLDEYYAAEKKKLTDKEFNDQQEKAKKLQRLQTQINSALLKASENPFKKQITPATVKAAGKESEFQGNSDIGKGVGMANLVVGGKQGAAKLISGLGEAGLNSFMPGLGEAAKPLLDAFTQGPDAVKAMVNEFADAIPVIVQGFIEAIPVFIETLADRAPDIITTLAEHAPKIITKLVMDAPRIITKILFMVPKIAYKFVESLIKNVPKIVSEIARAVYEALKRVLSKLNPIGKGGALNPSGKANSNFITTGPTSNGTVNAGLNIATGGGSGVVTSAGKSIKKFFGLARGGEPRFATGGQPFQDSINAKIQSGEMVIDRSTTDKIKKSMKNPDGNSELLSVMNEIKILLSNPVNVSTDVKLNQREFANIILTLNRQGQRLA